MTLVMDGVVRRGYVQMTPTPIRLPQQAPNARPVASQLRYVTGMDGIRRPLPFAAQPAQMAAVALPSAHGARALPFDGEALRALPWRRYSIGFGLVASALVFAGTVTWRLSSSEVSSKTPARTTEAAASKAVAITPAGVSPETEKAQLAAATLADQNTALQKLLNDFVGSGVGNWEIVVKDLKTGAAASINADRSETSASLYKLFVAQQIYQSIDQGTLSYTSDAGGGTGLNIKDCLTIMINISDNGCGRAMGATLGWGAQNPSLRAAGYTGTNLYTPQQTSAHDVATLLERVYRGTLNSPAANASFLALLKDQRVNNRLPVGLPAGTVIAHKTGDLDGFMHDAGFVYGPKTDYMVVAMGSPGVTPAQFVDLSSKLWSFFEN